MCKPSPSSERSPTEFWEVDTPETEYKEWGITYQVRTPLTTDDVARIAKSLAEGAHLPHGEFMAGGAE